MNEKTRSKTRNLQLPQTDRASAFVTPKILTRAGGRGPPCKNIPHIYSLIIDHAKFGCCFRCRARAQRSQHLGDAGAPPPSDWGVADPVKTLPPCMSPCQIWSFQVKQYEHNYRDQQEKYDPFCVQGHSKSSEQTRMIDRLPMTRGGFNRRPFMQWPTRPLGGWALDAPGASGARKAKFWFAIAKS